MALARFGGIWIDSTILMVRPFEEFIDLSKTSMQGYPSFGTLENWFFVAPFNNHLMKEWLQEFRNAWTMGPRHYVDLHFYETPGGLTDGGVYLTQHICFLTVLRRFPADAIHWLGGNTLGGAAWDPRHPFYWVARSNPGSTQWWACASVRTLFDRYGLDSELSQAPMFKFRGPERRCVGLSTITEQAKSGAQLPILLLDLLPSW